MSAEDLKAFTVIAFYGENEQISAFHVMARSSLHAFHVAAEIDNELEMVVALPGHLKEGDDMTFPSDKLMDSQTILDLPDVFNE